MHLATQALDVVRRVRIPAPVLVSWAGSILEDAWFRAGVARALARAGVRARWHAPAMAPVEAAAQRAAALARRMR